MYTIEDWKARTLAMQEEGIERAGNIGVACSTCWRKLPALPTDRPEYCKCGSVADPVDILKALGLETLGGRLKTNNKDPVLD